MRRALLLAGAVAAFAAALLIVYSGGLPHRADFTGYIIRGQGITAPEIGALAPDFDQPTTSGTHQRLHDLRGAPVVLNFWATWCVPCRVEMPILQDLYTTYQPQGLHILAVNLGEAPAVVRGWQQAMNLTYDILLDEQQAVAAAYHLRGQPSTYVIAPDGVIRHIFYGPVSRAALEAAIAPYIH